MAPERSVTTEVRAALERQPRINLHRHPIRLDYTSGVLVMEGEVEDVAAKKLSLEIAAATPGVSGIVDRLHVVPAQRLPDGPVLHGVRDALLQEPALGGCRLSVRLRGEETAVRSVPGARCWIEVRVTEGVVTLDGEVSSLAQKRLAGVLAWWVPGARDVVNGLGVVPPEEDNDEEITDAVTMVLEKDPFVNASQLRVFTENSVVTLNGVVPTEAERDMAERDAWYVFGVDRVENRLLVLPR